jgi:hypothetical protein
MLKKTITYTDFNGDEQTEDFYFNLTRTELTELEASVEGGYSGMLKEIVDSKKPSELLATFKRIILASVGVKSEDGKRFNKTNEFAQDFVSSPAFDELFVTLMNDEEATAAFVKGILPGGASGDFDAEMKKHKLEMKMKASEEKRTELKVVDDESVDVKAETQTSDVKPSSAPYSD